MDVIERKIRSKLHEYQVYSKEEAEKENIPFQYWLSAGVGQFALSDDGYVAECLSSKTYVNTKTGQQRTVKRFPYCKIWVIPGAKLEYLPAKGRLVGKKLIEATGWADREAGKTRTKNTVQAYVKMVLSGPPDWVKLGNIYRSDQKIPEATVRRLFHHPAIKKMVKEELKKVLEEQGVSKESVIKIIKEAIDIAKAIEQPMAMLKGAEHLDKIIDSAEESKQLTGYEYGITKEIEDSVLSSQKELKSMEDRVKDAEEVTDQGS